MAYYIGMRAGTGKVEAILLDEEFLFRHNKMRYLIYIRNSEGNNLWKVINEMPCVIEYDLNF